jgi:hypothetical protein
MIAYYNSGKSRIPINLIKMDNKIWDDPNAIIGSMIETIHNLEEEKKLYNDNIDSLREQNDMLGYALIRSRKNSYFFMGLCGILLLVVGVLIIV